MSESLLPVAILAGGLATRLKPLTEKFPKSLVDINGEPFIVHQLRLLRSRGIERVVLCIGYLGEMIREYVRDGSRFGLQVEYSSDYPKLLGTAGAIKQALPLLGPAFFVHYGDSYLRCDFRNVQAAFETSGKQGLMTVFKNEGRWEKSNVEFAGGQIRRYDKQHITPTMHHTDYGLGIFARPAFADVPTGVPSDLVAVYQALLRQGELSACEVADRFYEIGSLAGIEEIRRYLATQTQQVRTSTT